MKLYTEDAVKMAIESARENSFGSDFQRWLTKSEKSIMEELTSVELPSDEGIDAMGKDVIIYNDTKRGWFIEGLKFMRDKIQGGNK